MCFRHARPEIICDYKPRFLWIPNAGSASPAAGRGQHSALRGARPLRRAPGSGLGARCPGLGAPRLMLGARRRPWLPPARSAAPCRLASASAAPAPPLARPQVPARRARLARPGRGDSVAQSRGVLRASALFAQRGVWFAAPAEPRNPGAGGGAGRGPGGPPCSGPRRRFLGATFASSVRVRTAGPPASPGHRRGPRVGPWPRPGPPAPALWCPHFPALPEPPSGRDASRRRESQLGPGPRLGVCQRGRFSAAAPPAAQRGFSRPAPPLWPRWHLSGHAARALSRCSFPPVTDRLSRGRLRGARSPSRSRRARALPFPASAATSPPAPSPDLRTGTAGAAGLGLGGSRPRRPRRLLPFSKCGLRGAGRGISWSPQVGLGRSTACTNRGNRRRTFLSRSRSRLGRSRALPRPRHLRKRSPRGLWANRYLILPWRFLPPTRSQFRD